MAIRAAELDVYRTAVGMRSFEHAAASRSEAEAVVVRAAFSDGVVGWGETLPRPYVTGETLESVVSDLESVVWPALAELDFGGGAAEVAAALAAIPTVGPDGRCMNAAACAAELACVDAHLARRGSGALGGLLGTDGVGGVGRRGRIAARVSGVLGSADPAQTAWRLRLMRWYGLRDFKLKLGLGREADAANLEVVGRGLARALATRRCTLRVDVNGGWTAEQTPGRVADLAAMGVCAVEQPVFCPAGEFVDLARRCELPLIADESLVSAKDAELLLAARPKVWFNVRISKNGGLISAGRLVLSAAKSGSTVVLGCMVGESGILSAAQRRLLEVIGAEVRHVEGNYGRFLLAGDIVRRSPRFGYAGRLRVLSGSGLGVEVDAARLGRYGRRVARLGR